MRGKHGAKAAVRRSEAEAIQQIAELERLNRNLETENRRLTDDVERWKSAHAADSRALRAQIAAGTSAEVSALTELLKKANERTEKAEQVCKKEQERRDRWITRMVAWVVKDKGISGTEALELLVAMETGKASIISDTAKGDRDSLRSARIDAARGHRRFVVSGGEL